MTPNPLAVLWLCGAPGAGKSVTGWGLFEALGAEGVAVAYLDIDQLGMLYPDAEADDERHHLKARALAALVPHYAAAGAAILVVSGVVDPAGPADVSMSYPGLDLTFCLLTVDEDTLRERILARGWSREDADEAVADDAALRVAPFLTAVVAPSRRGVAEVVEQVRRLVPAHPVRPVHPARPPVTAVSGTAPAPFAPVGLTVVYGPRAVGSSTVGFGLARRRWRSGVMTGFVDLQQLAFVRRPGGHASTSTALGVANVAAMNRLFAAHGATHLFVSAHLDHREDLDLLRRTVPATVTAVRLAADDETLAAHIRERVGGSAARLAGDDLIGASTAHQTQVLTTSLAEQRRLRTEAAQDVLVDVTGLGADDAVEHVHELLDRRLVVGPRTGDRRARRPPPVGIPTAACRSVSEVVPMTVEIRPFRPVEDAAAHCAGEDELTVRWLTGGYGSPEGTTDYFEGLAAAAAAGAGKRAFGVWLSGRLCGYIDYDPDLDDGTEPGDVSLSYAVHPWARGQGVAVAAVRLVVERLRSEGTWTRVVIRVEPENARSVRVAVKAGFTRGRDFSSSLDTHADGTATTLRLYLRDL